MGLTDIDTKPGNKNPRHSKHSAIPADVTPKGLPLTTVQREIDKNFAQYDSGAVQILESIFIYQDGGITMLTPNEIEQLPQDDRAVARASHEYYWVLLRGAPKDQRRQRLQIWWRSLQRRWPDLRSALEAKED